MLALEPGDLAPDAAAELRVRSEGSPRTVTTASRNAHWTLVRLGLQGDLRGAIVLRTRGPLPRHVRDGVETLADQVALALEAVALAEDLHERQSAERFRSLVQNSSDVIMLLAQDLTIRYHTPSVQTVLGYGEDELVGRRLTDYVDAAEADRLGMFFADVRAAPGTPMPRDLPLRRRNGTTCHLESVFNSLLHDPNVAGVVVTARDVTERRALQEQLAHQAFHDSLTGLANRLLFADRVTHALERGRRRPTLVAVFLVDLDDFKTVNDSLGHAAGDELLVGVARRLEGCLRAEDTCARLGGDEFAILVEELPDTETAVVLAKRIVEAIAQPVTVLESEVVVHASVGIALGSSGEDADELLRSADLAMYEAKASDKRRFALYEPEMHERVLERLALKADLRRAVIEEEFELHYQPIVTLTSGAVVGVEALLRWHHPHRGLMLPDDFVPLAEETGLILPLGAHVLASACRQARLWRELVAPDLGISVNISAKQLGSASLPSEVTAALEAASLSPPALTLEITESVLLDSEAVIARLEALRALGVRIAIDDFGTGYSSLDYLRRFPVDTLKIAKAFVEELGGGAEQERLATAILRLGATLGLTTVAEGIENASQRDLLRRVGCRYGQGFFFSEPLPAAELEPVLRRALVA
jgi:diguanylate cyclase (GGDEF)-like protein/PAS domain S-box-containing protein